MGFFDSKSSSKVNNTQTNQTEQIGGGDVSGSTIASGGSNVTVNSTGDRAFDVVQGVVDTAFGSVKEISRQSRDVQAASLGGELSGREGEGLTQKNLLIAGAVIVGIVLFMKGKK